MRWTNVNYFGRIYWAARLIYFGGYCSGFWKFFFLFEIGVFETSFGGNFQCFEFEVCQFSWVFEFLSFEISKLFALVSLTKIPIPTLGPFLGGKLMWGVIFHFIHHLCVVYLHYIIMHFFQNHVELIVDKVEINENKRKKRVWTKLNENKNERD